MCEINAFSVVQQTLIITQKTAKTNPDRKKAIGFDVANEC